MKYSGSICVCVGLTFLFGCGKSEYKPVKTPEPKKFEASSINPEQPFPFKEGNSWVYSLEIARKVGDAPEMKAQAELTYTVKSVSTPAEGVTRATLELTEGGAFRDNQVWEVDKTGLYQVSIGKNPVPFSPRQLIVKYPFKDGDKYTYSGTGTMPIGGTGSMKYEYAMHDMQPIDTDSGPMNALFIESSGSFEGAKGKGAAGNNSWFVPDVGLGRFKQVIRDSQGISAITLRLKSYTIK